MSLEEALADVAREFVLAEEAVDIRSLAAVGRIEICGERVKIGEFELPDDDFSDPIVRPSETVSRVVDITHLGIF